MMLTWDELKYWETGEWQVVEERLDDLTKAGIQWCPGKKNLFAAMRKPQPHQVKVCIIGQDPYPNPLNATGVAFAVPPHNQIPPTLDNIFEEYSTDLHYPKPTSGDLSKWQERGVFLWNSIPSCLARQSASHRWDEWTPLTEEIVQKLDAQKVVFVLLGRNAQHYSRLISSSPYIATSHPSPLGVGKGSSPFKGSRLFTTVNTKLVEMGKGAIDWRL